MVRLPLHHRLVGKAESIKTVWSELSVFAATWTSLVLAAALGNVYYSVSFATGTTNQGQGDFHWHVLHTAAAAKSNERSLDRINSTSFDQDTPQLALSPLLARIHPPRRRADNTTSTKHAGLPTTFHNSNTSVNITIGSPDYHTNSTAHMAIIFTTGGGNQSCVNDTFVDAEKPKLLHASWASLVKSIHFTLLQRPNWRVTVRLVNDGLVECGAGMEWKNFRNALYTTRTTTSRSSTSMVAVPITNLQERLVATYTAHAQPVGIGVSMKESYAAIAALNDTVDYVTNFEDDLLCRKHWLLQLHQSYEYLKKQASLDTTNTNQTIPLLASAYNSKVFKPLPRRKTKKAPMIRPCIAHCAWKTYVYGANLFVDRATLETVVLSAFSETYRAYNNSRPDFIQPISVWDQWILDEYYEVQAGHYPGAMVLTPSLIQHVSKKWGMHAKKNDEAKDYVHSKD